MSIILAIETSTQQCSVALIKQGEYFYRSVIEERSHSRVLLPMIVDVLQLANCDIEELSALAVTHGPGTFTGLRIGLGAVKGLALGHDFPIYDVSSLAVMAYGLSKEYPNKSRFISLLDARMGELYAGYYQRNKDGFLTELKPNELISVNSYLDMGDCVLGGVGVSLLDTTAITQQEDEIATLFYPNARLLLDYVIEHKDKLIVKTASTLRPVYLRDKVV